MKDIVQPAMTNRIANKSKEYIQLKKKQKRKERKKAAEPALVSDQKPGRAGDQNEDSLGRPVLCLSRCRSGKD